ncbi:eukaryotic aspartyl protease (macronuclear) [Tetrahymena thermophila SB210]|uniref:Eukaryotic aspartyl protease n=2 Tax=Tetrahymena thermophila (strain SB210) TaxID=312017 RepID=Q22RW7_TETTS|nr:eukaryotic aspartyl protease [Tetrahymena thermophila SB210]EAR88005.2 eukaryotic aspartyl protease [Tetrahymena thermophila SB210]|eukprot:XP_001008250.2 eukaryotic aspartyl protease [Tetrahymena thermophila SB210]
MRKINKLLLIISLLLIAGFAARLKRSSKSKQQQLIADSIQSQNMKITLERDNTVEKKIQIINFIEESNSIRKNQPSFKKRVYDKDSQKIMIEEKEITADRKQQFVSMIQTNGKSVGLQNHGNTFYTGKIQVGNRDQYYKMIFDSGSTLIFLNSVQCDSIGCIRGNQYDSEASPTFKDVDLEVKVEFGSGILTGEMGIDTFYFGDMAVERVEFMEILEQDGAVFESGDFDGLIGLAFPQLGDGADTVVDYMKDQNLIPKKMFSFYMSRKDESDNSFISFGQIDQQVIAGDIKYHKVESPLYWTLLAQEIKLGGHKTSLCSREYPCPLAIDSGTSIIAGPSDQIDFLTDLILDRGFECNQIKKMPAISFVIDGEEYPILAEEYIISSNGAFANMYEHSVDPAECYPALVALDVEEPQLGPMWILGDIFMSKYYTLFNREDKTVGFAKLKSIDTRLYQKPSKIEDEEFNYNFMKKMNKRKKSKKHL